MCDDVLQSGVNGDRRRDLDPGKNKELKGKKLESADKEILRGGDEAVDEPSCDDDNKGADDTVGDRWHVDVTVGN